LLPLHQNAEQEHNVKIANRFSENVAQFRYLGSSVTNQNFIQEEIKRWLNLCNTWYRSVQNLLPSPLLPENIKFRTAKLSF
jgi:hypothetical protein